MSEYLGDHYKLLEEKITSLWLENYQNDVIIRKINQP